MLTVETTKQTETNTPNRAYSRVDATKQILTATLFREACPKSEIKINRQQLRELNWLHKQAYLEKPGWLRTSFTINQRRRKHLNNLLTESGLGGNWCSHCCDITTWYGMLHLVWHYINEEPVCR